MSREKEIPTVFISYAWEDYVQQYAIDKGYEWNRISRSDRLLLGTLFLNYTKKNDIEAIPIEKTSSGQLRYRIGEGL